MTTPTAAPGATRPAGRLHGRLALPSDKSIAHRALIVNALAGGPATVEVRAPGNDVLSTAACLRAHDRRVSSYPADTARSEAVSPLAALASGRPCRRNARPILEPYLSSDVTASR